jgi:hypothetical protein
VGTVIEESRVPLSKWLLAWRLVCSNKNGISAHELHRILGVTCKTAWFMSHRIRYALEKALGGSLLTSTVEADETYIGGKRESGSGRALDDKTPVVTVVERNGEARS